MKEKVIELYRKELNCVDIADELGIHRTTVSKILKKNGIEVKRKYKVTNTHCSVCEKEIKNNVGNRSRCQSCNTNLRRYRARKTAVCYLGGKCNSCGWSGDISGFDFHHKNRDKDFDLTGINIASKKWSETQKELDKCELLCALCHRLEHSNYADKLFLKEADNYDFYSFEEIT